MKDFFNLGLQEREQRRQRFHNALRAIDSSSQPSIGQANAEILRRLVLSTYVSTEVNDMVNRHLGPEAIASTLLGNNHRSRR